MIRMKEGNSTCPTRQFWGSFCPCQFLMYNLTAAFIRDTDTLSYMLMGPHRPEEMGEKEKKAGREVLSRLVLIIYRPVRCHWNIICSIK